MSGILFAAAEDEKFEILGKYKLKDGSLSKTVSSRTTEGFLKKTAVLLDVVQMRGRGGELGPFPIFCHLFIGAFLVKKRSLFLPLFKRNFG